MGRTSTVSTARRIGDEDCIELENYHKGEEEDEEEEDGDENSDDCEECSQENKEALSEVQV